MWSAALLILIAIPDDERAVRFYERTQFLKVEPAGDEARTVVDLLLKKEHWIGAYRSLEERFGPFPDNLTVTVDFNFRGAEMARGAGWGSEGRVSFNLEKMAAYQKRLNEIEAERDEARKQNRTIYFKVPPARFDRMIYHELTHVLQRSYDAPPWFNEGMAQLAGDDLNALCRFAMVGKEIQAIDIPVFETEDNYARGHVFWKWLQSQGLVKKAAQRAIIDRVPWKEVLEEVTGLSWVFLIVAEREWSKKECEKFRPKDSRAR